MKALERVGFRRASGTRKSSLGIVANWLKDAGGVAAFEFALVLPALLLVFFAIIKFGAYVSDYTELSDGVASGVRQASMNRGSTTPYSSTVTAIDAGAPNLQASNVTITITINGTACTSDTNAASGSTPANVCQTAYSNAQGTEAVVSATYPCNLTVLWITFSGCTLSSSASQLIE